MSPNHEKMHPFRILECHIFFLRVYFNERVFYFVNEYLIDKKTVIFHEKLWYFLSMQYSLTK